MLAPLDQGTVVGGRLTGCFGQRFEDVANVGEARFVRPRLLAELLAEADADGLLTVQLDAPGPGHRGRLA